MTVLLALSAALAYGLSDFLGGLGSRRSAAWPVAVMSAGGGLVGAIVLTVVSPGSPTSADWWWAVVAGLGAGVGIGFLYRGFAAGQMAVAGPVSAVGTTLLPVAVGLVGGEHLGALTWIGIAVAAPGLWLVAREPEAGGGGARLAEGLVDGVVAGLGFGVSFVALGQWGEDAGYSPFLLMQAANIATIVVLATGFRQSWRPDAAAVRWGGVAGVIASAALAFFLLAVDGNNLAVASVLTSLYPAVTVLLAVAVLRERISVPQVVGLVLCAGTVGLVAAG